MREVQKQKQEERQILDKIKHKMSTLKEKQASLKKNFVEPEEHFQGMKIVGLFIWFHTEVKYFNTNMWLSGDKKNDQTMLCNVQFVK